MLRDSPTLRSWRSMLATDRPESTKALRDLIASAARRAPGQEAGQAQPIHQDGVEVRPLMALASPLPRSEPQILLCDAARQAHGAPCDQRSQRQTARLS